MLCVCFSHLYYTTVVSSPHIGRSSLSGRNRQVLLSSEIAEPYDLTVDFASEKLFWIDRGRLVHSPCCPCRRFTSTFVLSVLFYGLECCPLNIAQIRSLDFAINSAFSKIFFINSHDFIYD